MDWKFKTVYYRLTRTRSRTRKARRFADAPRVRSRVRFYFPGGWMKTSVIGHVSDIWSLQDASELYDVASWGKGYVSINDAGELSIHPTKEPGRFISLKKLVDNLELRGISLPVLIRFNDILRHRLQE